MASRYSVHTSILSDVADPRERLVATLLNDLEVANLNIQHSMIIERYSW